ncbi:MAG TPA: 50S ribosomal protein L1 [bacterium]|nr:50S ribosomal protein L1 [Patescibacteria group bacterium]HPO10969.1 50S ribosomal protein L1 [bacterium]
MQKKITIQEKSKRSSRYIESSKLIEKNKVYSIEEAIELAKQTANIKFIPSIEVHIKLGIDLNKTDQQVKGTVILPYGTGKQKRIAVFAEGEKQDESKKAGADIVGGEELIEELIKNPDINFDVVVTTPIMMPKLAKLSKILGPKGLMPNPKTGTVTMDIKKAVEEQKAGKIVFRNDKTGNIHQIIGRTDFDSNKLIENYKALINAVKAAKPETVKRSFIKNISINSTMGPGIKVAF